MQGNITFCCIFTNPLILVSDRYVMRVIVPDDYKITASTEYDDMHGANNARLDRPAIKGGRRGGWRPTDDDKDPWIQMDFGSPRPFSGIQTQGRSDCDDWVTEFMVQYGTDVHDENTWKYVDQVSLYSLYLAPIKLEYVAQHGQMSTTNLLKAR